jgi:hypothetical protein
MNDENDESKAPPKIALPVQAVPSARLRPPCRGELVVLLPETDQPPLERLERLSFLMDRLFQIPGLRLRVGLNTILLLLPILGDVIPSFVGAYILVVGLNHYRVPRIVAVRMVLNTCMDAALGWIPILGDLFDLFYKADTRNVRLLQAYAGADQSKPHATWPHWVFVIGALVFFILACGLLVFGMLALVRGMNHSVNRMFGMP